MTSDLSTLALKVNKDAEAEYEQEEDLNPNCKRREMSLGRKDSSVANCLKSASYCICSFQSWLFSFIDRK